MSTVPCARCGKACLIGAPHPRADYALIVLAPAQAALGMCEECAAHWWIFSVDGLRWSFQDGPGVLRLPVVQAELGRVLGLMHPALAALDWGRLIAQWDLPWPKNWALPSEQRQ